MWTDLGRTVSPEAEWEWDAPFGGIGEDGTLGCRGVADVLDQQKQKGTDGKGFVNLFVSLMVDDKPNW